MKAYAFAAACVAAFLVVPPLAWSADEITPDEARTIAKEATIYGFPLVDSYRIQYSYFVDKADPEYKTGWNQLYNTARVYTPDDKAIQTPNSDTPYSFVGADLRAEPLVFTVPAIAKERYYSLQFIDMYTFNFAYVGSRATGNEAGSYLLAGPGWKGDTPKGIKSVIRSETSWPSCSIGPNCSIQAISTTSRRSRPNTRFRLYRHSWARLRRRQLRRSTS